MPTVHLKPKAGFSACGLGDPLTSESTSDIHEVNCGKCLRTVAAKKQRPEPKEPRPKVKISFSIDAELSDRLMAEENRSAIVNQALKQYYSRLM